MIKAEVIRRIKQSKIVAIIRGVEPKDMPETLKALYEGGIEILEITFNQAKETGAEETLEAIRYASQTYAGKMLVGAGTVMTPEQAAAAKEAGAQFILAPNYNKEVLAKAVELDLVSMPGAMTPSEIADAYQNGADIVKVFPAGRLGTGYIKDLQGPLGFIPMSAVGGVNLDNVRDFLAAGCVCAGIGGNLVNLAWIQEGRFDKIREMAASYVQKVKE